MLRNAANFDSHSWTFLNDFDSSMIASLGGKLLKKP